MKNLLSANKRKNYIKYWVDYWNAWKEFLFQTVEESFRKSTVFHLSLWNNKGSNDINYNIDNIMIDLIVYT